ncbi:hypothetical protein F5880DRAFT_852601 [Lentinula raphanica]|nr:hypothetical protein F5880DRAFT_852601 [Lentinula raphanica]
MALAETSVKRTRSSSLVRTDVERSTFAHSSESESDETYVVDPEFSNTKGDIYLKVENTLFPASIKILREVSGLFSDLFSIQQPENADLIYGLPYCEMFNCSEAELRILLKVIHGVPHVFQKTIDSNNLTEFNIENMLDALLVSAKYDLPEIRTQVKSAFLDFFGMLWSHIIFGHLPPETPRVAITGYTMDVEDAPCFLTFRMINVLKECQLEYCLPLAYYLAAQQTLQHIMDGVELDDGSIVELDDADQVKLMRGKRTLRDLRRQVTHMWLVEHVGYPRDYLRQHGCTSDPNANSCYDMVLNLYVLFYSPVSGLLEERWDALDSISYQAAEALKSSLCPQCYKYFTNRIVKCLDASFTEIPQIFMGKSWTDLRYRQAEIEEKWCGTDP